MATITAKSLGLGVCTQCHKVNKMRVFKQQCIRCGASFYQRKPKSLQYTLAWAIAALVCFFPANIYPIMVISFFGVPEASTILSGVEAFIHYGMYPIAAIIFIASVMVPLLKILGLFFLVYQATYHKKPKPKQHSKFYHILEFLGPWSMLDVFAVAILVAVVKLGFLSSIEAGPAINYFTLTVVFTMIAAMSFDPRLLWDGKDGSDEQ